MTGLKKTKEHSSKVVETKRKNGTLGNGGYARARKITGGGVMYDSLKQAAKINNVTIQTIFYRLKSTKERWSDWRYV